MSELIDHKEKIQEHPPLAPLAPLAQLAPPSPPSHPHPAPSEPKDETTVEEVTEEQPTKDYSKIYEKYLDRYKKSCAKSINLFNKEKNQRIALSYYIRRNNALLSILSELEPSPVISDDTTRIRKIIETAPRLSKTLTPLIENTTTISKQNLLNCILVEKIPDLINDDLINSEVNPQDIDSWCRRHYPNLVCSKYKPLNIQNCGVVSEYSGVDFALVGSDGEKISIPKKKRRIEKK